MQLDDSGEIVYKVRDFNNLGNQYIGNFKKGYKQCECCGKRVKITNNRVKYCNSCYKRINESDAKNRMKKYRETQNVTF